MSKILIVDDSLDLLEFLTVMFKARKYETATASTIAEAMKSLLTFSPDVILLDVKFPDSDGRDFCRKIKSDSQTCKTPVILISASPDLLENYHECKADAVIEKPFDIKIRYDTIESLSLLKR
ncbi:MAG TPA: response regulator [Ferruginibacter sp.]|nr:response regulator [Ferruginibacter sp.]